jgi:hypothetical protein
LEPLSVEAFGFEGEILKMNTPQGRQLFVADHFPETAIEPSMFLWGYVAKRVTILGVASRLKECLKQITPL